MVVAGQYKNIMQYNSNQTKNIGKTQKCFVQIDLKKTLFLVKNNLYK